MTTACQPWRRVAPAGKASASSPGRSRQRPAELAAASRLDSQQRPNRGRVGERTAWPSRARSWRSTRAPPRAAPSCSARTCASWGSAQREFAQHYPASGWVEHDPEDIWRTTVETARQALAAAGLGGRRHRRHRHHQPARDLRRLGPAHRQADPPRHRLAGPAHRRHVPHPEASRARADGDGQDRPAARPLLLGHQDRLAARPRRGRARARRGRPPRLRHHRHAS